MTTTRDDHGRYAEDDQQTDLAAAFVQAMERDAIERGLIPSPTDAPTPPGELFAQWLQSITNPEGDQP